MRINKTMKRLRDYTVGHQRNALYTQGAIAFRRKAMHKAMRRLSQDLIVEQTCDDDDPLRTLSIDGEEITETQYSKMLETEKRVEHIKTVLLQAAELRSTAYDEYVALLTDRSTNQWLYDWGDIDHIEMKTPYEFNRDK